MFNEKLNHWKSKTKKLKISKICNFSKKQDPDLFQIRIKTGFYEELCSLLSVKPNLSSWKPGPRVQLPPSWMVIIKLYYGK